MPRPKRVLPYLQKRPSGWYFRFKLPIEIQSLVDRQEIRLSLHTKDYKEARERAEVTLPYVQWMKRFRHMASSLTPEISEQILKDVFERLVDELERTRAPWMRPRVSQRAVNGGMVIPESFPPPPSRSDEIGRRIHQLQGAIQRGDVEPRRPSTEKLVAKHDCNGSVNSEVFRTLCLDLMKLDGMYWAALLARESGDYEQEEAFIDHYRTRGFGPGQAVRRVSETVLTEVWGDFYKERTEANPKPAWSERTAVGQQASFDEFVEVAGDVPVGAITREIIRDYLSTISRIPKNRQKLYPDHSIDQLLGLDLDDSKYPSSRTIAEKLLKIGAFLKWCRLERGLLEQDPTEGISVKTDSRSYAVFTNDDLKALFENDTYRLGKHKKSWQYWVPLLALYTGARQNELAQLTPGDVVQEDGVWILVITDYGEGQKIKTRAGVRKVPINKELLRLQFVEYAQALRDSERLFPDLKNDPNTWGRQISRWFNDTYKKKCGITNDRTGARKVFHSFRHTAITKAMSAGLPIQHCQQVFGHEASIMGETATYTHQFPVEKLVQVVGQLTFDLDHTSHLEGWQVYS